MADHSSQISLADMYVLQRRGVGVEDNVSYFCYMIDGATNILDSIYSSAICNVRGHHWSWRQQQSGPISKIQST